MKYLFFLLIAFVSNAQILHHQSISAQGKSVVTSQGLALSQTVGQASAGGSTSRPGYAVQQGFQQSLFSNNNSKTILPPSDVLIRIFPNPFSTNLSFEFGFEIKEELEINLHDALGRLVYSSKENVKQNRITISSLGDLVEGNYFVSLSAKNFKYSTQIIKLNL